MELIEDFLRIAEEKYPKLMWFLVRLLVSIGIVIMVVFGAMMIYLAFCPFVMLIMGKSIACFLVWFMMPIPLFVTWSASDITKHIYEEYIDINYKYWND